MLGGAASALLAGAGSVPLCAMACLGPNTTPITNANRSHRVGGLLGSRSTRGLPVPALKYHAPTSGCTPHPASNCKDKSSFFKKIGVLITSSESVAQAQLSLCESRKSGPVLLAFSGGTRHTPTQSDMQLRGHVRNGRRRLPRNWVLFTAPPRKQGRRGHRCPAFQAPLRVAAPPGIMHFQHKSSQPNNCLFWINPLNTFAKIAVMQMCEGCAWQYAERPGSPLDSPPGQPGPSCQSGALALFLLNLAQGGCDRMATPGALGRIRRTLGRNLLN
jgi:hypothetical protein